MTGRIAILGGPAEIRGWELAGLEPAPAEDAAQARAQWAKLPADVGLVILTRSAAAALEAEISAAGPLVAVLP
ncbi:hypothetical protein ODJ79_37410 [Actinoplanes sp. KI2]|uniref:hypothetical protein n=1 Tax=Actinoplanes sp. KI2 TaxID=2983315 RepID=UPI0021D5B9AD|nr:hypothetical protein [Actinoplanes sp. KI2]MCU7729427.1 hypothetical protein [Actinoplanes sp. KI2]